MTVSGRTLVVGLGHPDRGDDSVGSAVVRQVQSLDLDEVDVVQRDEPLRLLDLWAGYQRVVVVDAVRGQGPPGTVLVHDPVRSPLPTDGRASSHGLDLGASIELARSLHRLPAQVVLVGVEVADVGVGRPLSPAVDAAVATAVQAVLRSIDEGSGIDV